MKNILKKYQPLDTEEKIIAFFDELKREHYAYSPELALSILQETGKVNLELLKNLQKALQDLPSRTEQKSKKKRNHDSHHNPNLKKPKENILKKEVKEETVVARKKRLRKSESEKLIVQGLVKSLTENKMSLKEYKREYSKARKTAIHYKLGDYFEQELRLRRALSGRNSPQKEESSNNNKENKGKLSELYNLKWKDVFFQNGRYTFLPQIKTKNLKPLVVKDSMSLECYNYIRTYFEERLPNVNWRYNLATKEIIIVDEIRFKKAILMIVQEHKQAIIEKRDITKSIGKRGVAISFDVAVSKASMMSPSSFKIYKSKFIDYLVDRQMTEYKIVPLNESFDYKDSCGFTESAFLFSLAVSEYCSMIVLENVNPNRSTLLFYVKRIMYMDALKTIHAFMQSSAHNKRSELRMKELSFEKYGVIDYSSINHENLSDWIIQLKRRSNRYIYTNPIG